MNEMVRFSVHDGIGVITVDNPPVNALSPGVPEGILAAVKGAQADDRVKALVLIGAGRTFIAGADIKEFGKITSGERKQELGLAEVILAMEDSVKPIVAAVHGTALGGGLEVAMGAHYRVAVPSAQVGQPEVKLGLIPGAGGTQRLPRLAGVALGVEMCAFGEPIKAPAALEAGIVDRIVEGDLLTGAITFAREIAGQPARKPRERNEKLKADGALFTAAREKAR